MSAAALFPRTEINNRMYDSDGRPRAVVKYGTICDVSFKPVAKLMHYLDRVCHLLDMSREGDLTRLRDHRRWHSLTEAETDFLVELCFVYSPKYLCGTVIFRDEKLCKDVINGFYDLIDERTVCVYGRQTTTAHTIMTCGQWWLDAIWQTPMGDCEQRLARIMPQVRRRYCRRGDNSSCCCVHHSVTGDV